MPLRFNSIKIAMIVLSAFGTQAMLAQPGAVDTSFNPTGTPGLVSLGNFSYYERVLDLKVDSLGRVVVLYSALPAPERGLVLAPELIVTRLLDTGTVDATFATGGFHTIQLSISTPTQFDLTTAGLAIGPADEIYIGYSDMPITGPPIRRSGPSPNEDFKVAKLSATGMHLLDTTFGFDLITDGSDRLYGLEVCGSALYAVGSAQAPGTGFTADAAVARLNTATMALDTSFSSDGKVIISVNQGGDNWDSANAVTCFATSVLVAGFADGPDDTLQGLLFHLEGDGSPSVDFGPTGFKTYRAPALNWTTADSQRQTSGAGPLADTTFFEDLMIDQNGLLWAAGGARNSAGDLDAIVLVTDLTGTIITSEGEGGWQGVGSTTLGQNPIRGVLPTVPTTDYAVGVFETNPGEITVAASADHFSENGFIAYGFAFRLKYPGTELDPSFNGDGNNDGIVHPELPRTGVPLSAAAADRHGRLLIGGDFQPSPGDLDGWIGRIHGNELFIDGFESGNTGVWAPQIP